MTAKLEGSLLHWIVVAASVLMSGARWTWHFPSRVIAARRANRALRQSQLDGMLKKLRHLECEHRALAGLCERMIRDRNYYHSLYLQALRTNTAA